MSIAILRLLNDPSKKFKQATAETGTSGCSMPFKELLAQSREGAKAFVAFL